MGQKKRRRARTEVMRGTGFVPRGRGSGVPRRDWIDQVGGRSPGLIASPFFTAPGRVHVAENVVLESAPPATLQPSKERVTVRRARELTRCFE